MPTPDPVDLVTAIQQKAPFFQAEGRNYYIVERDIQLEDTELLQYVQQLLDTTPPDAAVRSVNPYELVAATIDGKPMRWKPGTQLMWFLDVDSFPCESQAQATRAYAAKAAADWNEACVQFNVNIQFQETFDAEAAVFRVRYQAFDDPKLYAVAFFPADPAFKRLVRVGPTLLKPGSHFQPAGVLRHELGHVLGFRHEHIRPQTPQHIEPWIVGEIGAEVLTAYDPQSLMHYPMTAGYGTTDFLLTESDRQGLAKLYQMDPHVVREFEP